MIVKTYGSALQGVHAITITIEVNVSSQGNKFFIVGLPDNAVKESEQRITSALQHLGLKMPRTRTVVNLAPADIRKVGTAYDLPIAIGILAACERIPADILTGYLLMGELSLDGTLLPVRGALSMAMQARTEGYTGIILPASNAEEAALVEGIEVYGANHLEEVITHLAGEKLLTSASTAAGARFLSAQLHYDFDFNEVKGQQHIKRALEIAAAGGHNAILIGPPGAGKTMLARRFPSILPPMLPEEALETTKIYSVAGKLAHAAALISQRPFRAPHHGISNAALVGGGSNIQPGEISLAHNGVLFLDELPEFKRDVLEVMRQPMEERLVTIARAKQTVEFPADFMLLASMNPCPCGYFNHPEKKCSCAPGMVYKYLNKISGPLMDRIDLHVEVTPVTYSALSAPLEAESSSIIRDRVIAARMLQRERFKGFTGISCNAQMNARMMRDHCNTDDYSRELLKSAMKKLQLSARAYDRILKVSRTIADLDKSPLISAMHLAEAIQYRSLDRQSWGGS
ncbi:YifB family Mg chelatase-like AAA ATPase [Chitinophaga sp. Hz27]|uniref:YifB family Mg chelatase-like AAA ATPase n=1 Tax=Chitinophaga sp. Hz27 TaxID=3347169 RepID=UPI0035D61B13